MGVEHFKAARLAFFSCPQNQNKLLMVRLPRRKTKKQISSVYTKAKGATLVYKLMEKMPQARFFDRKES